MARKPRPHFIGRKTYHIDYIFISDRIEKEDISIEIKESIDYIRFSDHVPIVVDIIL